MKRIQAGAELCQAQFQLGLAMLAGHLPICSFAGVRFLRVLQQQVGVAAAIWCCSSNLVLQPKYVGAAATYVGAAAT